MITYLGFKRTLFDNETGNRLTETKFVPVEIPELDVKDGWKLVGSSDFVEVVPMIEAVKASESPLSGEQLTMIDVVCPETEKTTRIPQGSSFDSPVEGTAKLVRSNNDIFIAYRKGKKTLNETSPNSVCISEYSKSQFFAACRRAYGKSCEQYRFSTGCQEYDFWNKFMDEEYKRQLDAVNKMHV